MKILETIIYTGPNRRTGARAIETLFEAGPGDMASIPRDGLPERLIRAAPDDIAPILAELSGSEGPRGDPLAVFASLHGAIAVALQRAAGHDVDFRITVPGSGPGRIRSVFEYEQEDVGHRARDLAIQLMITAMPDLDIAVDHDGQAGDFGTLFEEFQAFAEPFIFPPDAKAIMGAAAGADIPCVKLERLPYEGLGGDFRIRLNGLLKLGHCGHSRILDGTLCINQSAHLVPLFWDRVQLHQRLQGMGLPVPARGGRNGFCRDAAEAERAATDIGFPVVVKPRRRTRGRGISLGVAGPDELAGAVSKAARHGDEFIVEKHTEGETLLVLAVGGKVIAAWSGDEQKATAVLHPETAGLVRNLAAASGAGMLLAQFVMPDPAGALSQGGVLADLDFAPELDRFMVPGSGPHRDAMTEFVKWLYPPGATSRIPLVAVTGTNGKTTTCRMIAAVAGECGHRTGMACSDGIYIEGRQTESGDRSGTGGHHRVFESQEVDFGVLETARGAVANTGFMFDWCNVAVCLNVTRDHLGEYGIHTLDQMAEIKRSVLERARDAVVVNADDARCRGMLPGIEAKKSCLVSMHTRIEDLSRDPGQAQYFSVLEEVDGAEHLVFYDRGRRVPVIGVTEIPATFGGRARFNISNALHAVAACCLAGMDPAAVAAALRRFDCSPENNPGRLNFYHGLPFTVLMDYAHNVDGFRKLADFASEQEVRGRRMLMFQIRGDMGDEYMRKMAREVAGRYDRYVFRSHPVYTGPDPQHVLDLVRSVLTESGVTESQLTMTTDPGEAVDILLDMGREGDLLVLAPGVGQRDDTWSRIVEFEKDLGR